ncbi:hypothetical protein G7Y89_g2640 [Cudoniella acicularis]|uniref:Arylamine N-acetyltransferase n=1 Tax=Cudoniella acicularis TaxID=354080 RepID=A0A8H4RVY4_9HELO|nr:hypothetical protein G7Y89_g2640 [Cudoniella acicularis]
MSRPQRPKTPYFPEDVDAYLSQISFPTEKYPKIGPEIARSKDGLEFLAALQGYQLASVPFENLILHYSSHRAITLDKDVLFDKIIASNCGRGGYCMENNLFFGNILKSLGFEVISTGARVAAGNGGCGGWSHQVNLVPLGDEVYMVDVGFGGEGPTRPMPLIDGVVSKWGATDAETRLTYKKGSKSWIPGMWSYEHRKSRSHNWTTVYSFGTTEFHPPDFEVMNFASSNRRTSFFTYRILVVKLLLDKEVGDITGAIILNGNEVKKRVYNKSEIIAELKTEEERVKALSKHFGIFLTDRERAGIRGTVTELK